MAKHSGGAGSPGLGIHSWLAVPGKSWPVCEAAADAITLYLPLVPNLRLGPKLFCLQLTIFKRLMGQFHIFRYFKNKRIKVQTTLPYKIIFTELKGRSTRSSGIHVSQWLQQGAASLCYSAIATTFLLPTVSAEGSPTEIKLAGSYALLSQVILPALCCLL